MRSLKDVCAQIHYLGTGAERAQPWLHGSLHSSLKETCWHMLKVTSVSLQETKPSLHGITNRLIARTGRKLYLPIRALSMKMAEVRLSCFWNHKISLTHCNTLLTNMLSRSSISLPAAKLPSCCFVSWIVKSNILLFYLHTDRASQEWPVWAR